MITKEESESLENKIDLINLSMLVAFFTGLAVTFYAKNIWFLSISFALLFGLWIFYAITELIKSVKELKPDGWLSAVEAIWNY